MIVLYILIAILIFGIIIMIHELGHFTVAKLCGIKVNEFAIGMGPKIISWGKKRDEILVEGAADRRICVYGRRRRCERRPEGVQK